MRTLTDGDKIRRLREEQGLTAPQLAAKAGIDYRHLNRIENNRREGSEPIRLAIAKALDISLDEITFRAHSRRQLIREQAAA